MRGSSHFRPYVVSHLAVHPLHPSCHEFRPPDSILLNDREKRVSQFPLRKRVILAPVCVTGFGAWGRGTHGPQSASHSLSRARKDLLTCVKRLWSIGVVGVAMKASYDEILD